MTSYEQVVEVEVGFLLTCERHTAYPCSVLIVSNAPQRGVDPSQFWPFPSTGGCAGEDSRFTQRAAAPPRTSRRMIQ
jgi:hypothetical protein